MVGHLTYTLEKNCFAKKEYFLWKEKLWRNSGSLLFLLKERELQDRSFNIHIGQKTVLPKKNIFMEGKSCGETLDLYYFC
jgi:hypothetical protein